MKAYHFHLKAGKDINLNMQTTPQGWIILDRFVPDYLKMGYSTPLVGAEINSVEEDEFETDCMRMIYCFDDNNLNYRDSQHCFEVLNAVVDYHIRQYGRLIFNDLLTYTSEMCELMSGMGYSIPTLKILFPNFVAACIGRNESDIKESLPSDRPFDRTPRLISFTGTPRYRRLAEMCPPLTKVPTL